MPTNHAKYGGSTAARTLNCPAWAQLSAKVPPQGSSEFADRGTLLHNAMEAILLHPDFDYFQEGFDYTFVIGSKYEDQILTDELFAEKILPAVAAVKEIFDTYGIYEYAPEEQVTMHPEAWGTADLLASGEKDGVLYFLCLDYKFGDGIPVKAEGNVQGMFYSTAAAITPTLADMYPAGAQLVIAIVQPSSHTDEDYTVWEPEDFDPEDFCKTFLAAMAKAEQPDPEPCPGSWCAFCAAEAICPAKTGELQALQRMDLVDLKNLPSFAEVAAMESTLKAIKKLAHEQLEQGVQVPGYKLVAKRASRVYADLAAVELKVKNSKKLKKEDAYDYKLKTPAQLEKVLKSKGIDYKRFVGDSVQSVSSGNTLAAENDKRPAVIPGAALQALAGKLT